MFMHVSWGGSPRLSTCSCLVTPHSSSVPQLFCSSTLSLFPLSLHPFPGLAQAAILIITASKCSIKQDAGCRGVFGTMNPTQNSLGRKEDRMQRVIWGVCTKQLHFPSAFLIPLSCSRMTLEKQKEEAIQRRGTFGFLHPDPA